MKALSLVAVLALVGSVAALESHYSRFEQGNAYNYVPAQQEASVNYAQSFDPKYIPQFREDPAATDSIEQSQPAGEVSETETPPTAESESPEENSDPSGADDAANAEPAEPAAAEGEPTMTPALVQNPNPESEAQGVALPPEPTLAPVGHSDDQSSEEDAPEETDPEILKLNSALEAVKEDIISNSKQIGEERMWVAAVVKITAAYQEKVQRVRDHIIELRKEMKKLYEKKKQIENLKLQRALEKKLQEANDELNNLQSSLSAVQEKDSELRKSHEDLQTTIASIEAQLAKLKGEDPAAADEKEKEDVDEDSEEDKLEDNSDASAASLETSDDA